MKPEYPNGSSLTAVPSLRDYDLNLLPIFEAVYEERQQSAAARRMDLTQPTVSKAIARLREITRDRLFVNDRSTGMLMPTPYAMKLYSGVHESLSMMRSWLPSQHFDKQTTTRSFAVASHGSEAYFGPSLFHRLIEEAPNARLSTYSTRNRPIVYDHITAGRVDVAVDWALPPRQLAFSEMLPVIPIVICRADHPDVGDTLRFDDLMQHRFVLYRSPQDDVTADNERYPFPSSLAHRCVFDVSTAAAVPTIAAQTNLLGVTTPSILLTSDSRHLLRWFRLPEMEPLKLYAIWDASRSCEPALQFFRDLTVQTMDNIKRNAGELVEHMNVPMSGRHE